MKKIIYILGLIAGICVVFNSCSEDGLAETGSGTLEGKVVMEGSNTPIANAKITTNPVTNTVFTDENGNFSLGQVQVGDYSVQAEVDDFITGFEPANVQDGRTINVVFELLESSVNNIEPLAPVLVFPADNANGIDTQVDFIWNSSMNDTDPIVYTFELRNGTTNEIMMAENLEDTTYSVSGLSVGTNYFWQVTASDDVNAPVESALSSFTTVNLIDKRFFFVRKEGDNNVIFSGDDISEQNGDPDQGVFQLTASTQNSFRPRKNLQTNKLAFLRTVGADTHLFTMNLDGTEVDRVTNEVPVAGFRQDEVDFAWFNGGQKLYYANLNKMYSINVTGTGRSLEYQVAPDRFISEIDTNEANDFIAIKTNDASGYNARIVIIDPSDNSEVAVVIENQPGAVGGVDFSIDGTKLLYTWDVSGFESASYRQLDSRIFEYDFNTAIATELATDKPSGTNDLDARYSPDEGAVIFMNTSNDGVSQRNIYKFVFSDVLQLRKLLFTNSFMPDWE
ncbi:carboxypeptidase-like regulatory domain-containing protein [Aureisphaera galaxeae]|uniref:carboxypeptidase-like regulatory domain-containing protein n=1 Tax=Aureisphaera galaxeae TaxID=1538023 RepID=UPI002350C60D|nr:carboxypeptidase-like regulatory domain-containing protein [Aureisphaera galaxeae]MDC8006199.1 carboxypeptidase-like regulatory domain-containing protein [Aureisphaera galaxeae]